MARQIVVWASRIKVALTKDGIREGLKLNILKDVLGEKIHSSTVVQKKSHGIQELNIPVRGTNMWLRSIQKPKSKKAFKV